MHDGMQYDPSSRIRTVHRHTALIGREESRDHALSVVT